MRFCLSINDIVNEYKHLTNDEIANQIKDMIDDYYISERISEGGETIGFRRNTDRIINVLQLLNEKI